MKEITTGTTRTDDRLRGRALLLVRVVWLALALFNLILIGINLLQPLFGGQTSICAITFTCPPDGSTLSALQQAHISLTAYTSYATVIGFLSALLFVGLSVLIFWRAFDQGAGLLASFCFLLFGLQPLAGDLSSLPTALELFVNVIQTLMLLFCLGFFLVTFPDGRFAPRWSWLIGCTLFVQGILFMLPGPFNILSWPLPLFLIELAFAYSSPVAIQVYRYRRIYTPAQRQQTRWVIFGLVCFLLLFLFANVMDGLITAVGGAGSLFHAANPSLMLVASLFVPLSVTIAILRSRLWDIDVIIRRTLVYSTLTVILVLIYVGLVLVFGTLVRHVLGQQENPLVIVASTLVIAALFQPLRLGIQRVIDRRFYRRKYNATRTVEAFSATLRNEVELNQLREHLLTIVQETMQPAHVSLWLRPTAADNKPTAFWVSTHPVPEDGTQE
jgi:hypothetical protein